MTYLHCFCQCSILYRVPGMALRCTKCRSAPAMGDARTYNAKVLGDVISTGDAHLPLGTVSHQNLQHRTTLVVLLLMYSHGIQFHEFAYVHHKQLEKHNKYLPSIKKLTLLGSLLSTSWTQSSWSTGLHQPNWYPSVSALVVLILQKWQKPQVIKTCSNNTGSILS